MIGNIFQICQLNTKCEEQEILLFGDVKNDQHSLIKIKSITANGLLYALIE